MALGMSGSLAALGAVGESIAEDVVLYDCHKAVGQLVHDAVHPEMLEARKRPVEIGQLVDGQDFWSVQHRHPFAFIDKRGDLFMGFYRATKDGALVIQSDGSGRLLHLPAERLVTAIPLSRRRPPGLPLAIRARLDSENQRLLKPGDEVLLYVMDDSRPMVYRFLDHDIQGDLIFQELQDGGSITPAPRILSPGVFDRDGFGILMDRAPQTTP